MVATRDFFGLGSVSPDLQPPHLQAASPRPAAVEDASLPPLPVPPTWHPSGFPSFDGVPNTSGDRNISLTGTSTDPAWNESAAVYDFLSLRNVVGAKHIEGSADSQLCISQSQLHLNGIGRMTKSDPRLFAADTHSKQNGGQLTIFYAGHVNVYEDVPAGKARAIMDLAATTNASPKILNGSNLAASHPFKKQPLQLPRNVEHLYFNVNDGVQMICQNHYAATEQVRPSSPPAVNMLLDCHTASAACSDSSSQLMVPQALPQARKASLTRFLERRKERMHVICPYMKMDSAKEQSIPSPIPDTKSGASTSKQYDLNSIVMAISGSYYGEKAAPAAAGADATESSVMKDQGAHQKAHK